MFIVFEGGEGSGKTSQINLLKEYIQNNYNKKVIVVREPGGTMFGENIRNLLLNKNDFDICVESEIMLFFASRMQLINEVILPEIENNSVIICDRFIDSSRVYQGFVQDNIKFVDNLIDMVIPEKLKKPDITFVLDVDANIGLSRSYAAGDIEQRFEEYGVEYHAKINNFFKDLPNNYNNFYNVINVNNASVDCVFENVIKIFKKEILDNDNWSR